MKLTPEEIDEMGRKFAMMDNGQQATFFQAALAQGQRDMKATYLTRNSPDIEAVGYCERYCEWKLDVGAECNRLLEVAEAIQSGKWQAEGDCRPFDAADAEAIRSIVQRVADFEGLETEE